jgi:hypothetical protein
MVGVTRGPLTRDDLLSAWLDARRFEKAHDDLRDFHERRLNAMQAAFGVDLARGTGGTIATPAWLVETLREIAPGRPIEIARHHLMRLFDLATEGYLMTGSPFAAYLEAPPTIAALHQRHRRSFDQASDAVRSAHRALLLDLLELLWGLDAETRVDRAAVIANGFDPDEREPEPEDYW